MDTTPTIPPQLEDAVKAEAEAHGSDETTARWLVLLLQDDPTLPIPRSGSSNPQGPLVLSGRLVIPKTRWRSPST